MANKKMHNSAYTSVLSLTQEKILNFKIE